MSEIAMYLIGFIAGVAHGLVVGYLKWGLRCKELNIEIEELLRGGK